MDFHSENGLELLMRISRKPQSINLDEVLFSGDINNESIIEIVGAPSTGKTLLLCQLLAKCILPTQYEGIKINGCDSCAILIDTLGHIQISTIAEFMTSAIYNAYQSNNVPSPSARTVDSIVIECLKNLTVVSCCNNVQFQLTLHMLEDKLVNKKIALLAIDNILAYYWQEKREKGILFSMKSYVRNFVKLIEIYTSQFKIVTIYTRWDEPFKNKSLQETSVNYRLQLYKSNMTREFMCRIETAKDIKQICYIIYNSSIKWIIK